MSIEDAFARIQAEEREKELRNVLAQMRKFLAGALCAVCGEALGSDEEIIQDDEDNTMHARCEPKDDDYAT